MMIKDFDTVREQLKELSGIINSYKSEAVQLRLVELIFGSSVTLPTTNTDLDTPEAVILPSPKKRGRKKATRSTQGTTDAPVRPIRASSRPGARSTLAALVTEGFFKQPRTIGSIVAHSDTHLASKFKQSEFSGTLARYVREKKLTRAKNADGQFEYKQP